MMMRQTFSSTTMRRQIPRQIAIFLALLLAFAMGCASNTEPVEEAGSGVDTEFRDGSEDVMIAAETVVDVSNRSFDIPSVYFDLDQYDVQSKYSSALEMGATALRESGATIVIAGNCDERGSDDYNVALGERRATAVRNYLYNLGVPMSQMSIVSYGEARPAVSGSGEAAWRLNRRTDFTVR